MVGEWWERFKSLVRRPLVIVSGRDPGERWLTRLVRPPLLWPWGHA